VDAGKVQQITRNLPVTPVPAAPAFVAGVASIKGKAATVLSLPALRDGGPVSAGPRSVSAVVFKPVYGEDDRMCVIIDKPGDLIEIDEKNVQAGIGGVTEAGGLLYRMIDPEAIITDIRRQ
jgi:chemotaxis signal transduction protein